MNTVFEVAAVIVSFLLCLKVYEIITGIVWAWNYGEAYTRDMSEAMKRWRISKVSLEEFLSIISKHKRKYNPSDWAIRGFLIRYLGSWGNYIVARIFRLYLLFSLQVLILLVVPKSMNEVLVVGFITLFITIWIEVIHMLSNRLTFGYTDTYFLKLIVKGSYPHSQPTNEDMFPTRTKMLQDFTQMFIVIISVIVIGYTALYISIQKLIPGAFVSIDSNSFNAILDFLYFSVVTLATVGYGDIHPVDGMPLIRLLVASQIIASFLVVVYLLTSFTLTVEPD